jgi:hypothetical protein
MSRGRGLAASEQGTGKPPQGGWERAGGAGRAAAGNREAAARRLADVPGAGLDGE